jgi:simple sugar transport system ATP-binding protein
MFVEMKDIVKRFPGVVACDHVSLEVERGEIHALLGENGAGKTTLMNVLYGLYRADEGNVYFKDKKVDVNSPRDAMTLGIGMVHQHFMLVQPLTAAENIVLGTESAGFLGSTRTVKRKITELSQRYGLKIDCDERVWQMSVGEKQRVEIIKALYRGADLLILDEPTAVLTPREAAELFATLRLMTREGHAVIFITHKLDEVMAVSDRVTVLRNGRVVSTVRTSDTTKSELAKMMVGREVIFQLTRTPLRKRNPILEVRDVCASGDRGHDAILSVSLTVHEGEIFGIAGVDGNGQSELAEVVAGLRKATAGKVFINGCDLTNRAPGRIMRNGVGHIPEDRMEGGLMMNLSVAENLILEVYYDRPFSRWGILDERVIRDHADKLTSEFDVRITNTQAQSKTLSGGNLQKLILARVLSRKPRLILANKPTRGLDVASTQYVRSRLLAERERGSGILLISADLDEILMMSDTVGVMYSGRMVGTLSPEQANKDVVGSMMLSGSAS